MLDRPQAQQWDAKGVRSALAEAFRVLHAIEGRVGHSRVRAAWPEYMLEPIDIAEQRLAKNIHQGRLRAIIKPTSLQISRMETVLLGTGDMPGWLNGAVKGYPDHRRVLIAAVQGQAKRYSGREVARWLGMPEATFRLHRDFGADIIARHLIRAGVDRWN